MIVVYSKEQCPKCDTAIGLLKSKGIEHEVKKLDTDFTYPDLLKITKPVIPREMPQIVITKEDGTSEYLGAVPELIKYLKSI